MFKILWWEITQRKFFALWWAIGVSALVGITNLSYLAIDDQAIELDDAFAGLTESAGAFFGGTDFFSPVGFMSSQIYYILLPLLVIIMSVNLVSRIMAKDEDDTTVELVLSRPLSRTQVLLAKATAIVAIVTAVGIVSYGVAAATVAIADIDINHGYVAMTHFLSFAFSFSFAALGFMLIAVGKPLSRIAGVLAMLLSFGGYVITSLAGIVDGIDWLAKLMPYYYYDSTALLEGTVDRGLVIYLVAAYVLVVIVSWLGYRRRDIS